MRSRTSVLALDRNERDQRSSFSQATRTTLRRSLFLSSKTLDSREASGGDGGGEAMVSSAAHRQIGGEAVGERERGRK